MSESKISAASLKDLLEAMTSMNEAAKTAAIMAVRFGDALIEELAKPYGKVTECANPESKKE